MVSFLVKVTATTEIYTTRHTLPLHVALAIWAGQIVAAAIVRDETAEINEASIQRDLRPLLSSFKIPKIIRFVERLALPRTPSDKIRRAEVARLYREGKL